MKHLNRLPQTPARAVLQQLPALVKELQVCARARATSRHSARKRPLSDLSNSPTSASNLSTDTARQLAPLRCSGRLWKAPTYGSFIFATKPCQRRVHVSKTPTNKDQSQHNNNKICGYRPLLAANPTDLSSYDQQLCRSGGRSAFGPHLCKKSLLDCQ